MVVCYIEIKKDSFNHMVIIMKKSLAVFVAVTGLLLSACSGKVTHPANKNYSDYSSLEVYDGTFDSFMYVEEYQNHLYLILDMYYDKLQPYIINTGEFERLLSNQADDDAETDNLPTIDYSQYVSDYDLLAMKSNYKITHALKDSDTFTSLSKDISDFKFEILFSEKGFSTGEFVQRLESPISFKLLNDGKPIPAIA